MVGFPTGCGLRAFLIPPPFLLSMAKFLAEGEEADDYEFVESSSGDDDSYHSDNDEIAEYWDSYRKSISASCWRLLVVCIA